MSPEPAEERAYGAGARSTPLAEVVVPAVAGVRAVECDEAHAISVHLV